MLCTINNEGNSSSCDILVHSSLKSVWCKFNYIPILSISDWRMASWATIACCFPRWCLLFLWIVFSSLHNKQLVSTKALTLPKSYRFVPSMCESINAATKPVGSEGSSYVAVFIILFSCSSSSSASGVVYITTTLITICQGQTPIPNPTHQIHCLHVRPSS